MIIDCIQKRIDSIEAIYLFRSLARGSENAESDYDIVVFVSKSPKNDAEAIFNVRYPLIGKLKRPMDLIIIDVEDLAHPSVILYNIYKDRRLLFGRDVLENYERIVSRMKPVVANCATVGYYV
ncbi:MAG: nucleotidyltransferase domain-containing protein [Methanocella sp.]